MYVSEVRGRRVSGQKRGGLIPCFLDADAAAVAGFVAAGEEDHPIFWTLGGVRGGGERTDCQLEVVRVTTLFAAAFAAVDAIGAVAAEGM